MELIPLTLTGITYSQAHTCAYALILGEGGASSRKLPIIIGAWEAQSIAVALQGDVVPKRPVTHDLFYTFAVNFGIRVTGVLIYKLLDGIFYSSVTAVDRSGIERQIDSRTSDAVALALRFHAPIYTYGSILDQAGIYFQARYDDAADISDESGVREDEPDGDAPEEDMEHPAAIRTNLPENGFDGVSTSDLYEKLEEAVQNEDYELAARIRDEIKDRNKV